MNSENWRLQVMKGSGTWDSLTKLPHLGGLWAARGCV